MILNGDNRTGENQADKKANIAKGNWSIRRGMTTEPMAKAQTMPAPGVMRNGRSMALRCLNASSSPSAFMPLNAQRKTLGGQRTLSDFSASANWA